MPHPLVAGDRDGHPTRSALKSLSRTGGAGALRYCSPFNRRQRDAGKRLVVGAADPSGLTVGR